MTTYRRKWEPIGDALRRIVDAELPEEEAKIALCEEISDGRISLRQELAADHSRGLPKDKFDGLPRGARLSPEDIDWTNSRPSEPLSPIWTHASRGLGEPVTLFTHEKGYLIDRTVEVIKVRSADVTRIFCSTEKGVNTLTPASPLERKDGGDVNRPMGTHDSKNADHLLVATMEVIRELWPEGVRGVKAKDRERRINERLVARGGSTTSASTILRALRKLKNSIRSV